VAPGGVPGAIGARARGDFNTEYTEFAEGTEKSAGRDRSARRTARGGTDETRKQEC
jgi:hypothetical protein